MKSEEATPRRTLTRPIRRLLSNEEAAEYLGYRSTSLLKNLPLKPIHLTTVGVGQGPRWDIVALDRWLDQLSGIQPLKSVAESEGQFAQAAFEEWEAQHAAKRA